MYIYTDAHTYTQTNILTDTAILTDRWTDIQTNSQTFTNRHNITLTLGSINTLVGGSFVEAHFPVTNGYSS